MNLQNHYWYFQSVIPPKVCDDIVRYANSIKDQIGVTGRFGDKKLNDSDISDLKKERNSNIVWLYDKWIYREIHPYVHRANENAGWNFEIEHSEDIQFTEYEKGGYYYWHSDGGSDHHAKYSKETTKWEAYHNKVRKLSMTVNLSHRKDYDGGDLLINYNNREITCKEASHRGSIIVFPSFYQHKISPITKGVRNSLVMWTLGNPFK